LVSKELEPAWLRGRVHVANPCRGGGATTPQAVARWRPIPRIVDAVCLITTIRGHDRTCGGARSR
jgi:hypothetical protein